MRLRIGDAYFMMLSLRWIMESILSVEVARLHLTSCCQKAFRREKIAHIEIARKTYFESVF